MAEVVASGMRFRFRAWDPNARTERHGEVTAESPAAVRAQLRERGWEPDAIHPVVLRERRWQREVSQSWRAWRRSRRRLLVADLCAALAALLHVGIPLDQALGQLASSPLRSLTEARLLEALAEALRAGQSFGDACAAHDDWFDPFDVAVLAAGQRAGELAPVLQAISAHHQRQGASSQQLITALAYPAIVAIAGVGVFIFLTQVVLPRIASILTAARTSVPWLTAQVMAWGDLLMWAWPLLLIGVIVVWSLVGRWMARVPASGRLGRCVHGNALARLRARTRVAITSAALARLLRAGVPLTEALGVVAATVPDRALRALLTAAVQAVERGQDLSTVMAASPLVEPEFAHLLRLGEGSGDLPAMLDQIAERYHEASSRSAERVAAIIGPLALILLACLIGVLVLAVGQALARVADLV